MSEKYKPRVLVVEDDPRDRQQLKEMLETEYVVDSAEGHGNIIIKKAIKRAKQFRPHVAIIDLSLDPINSSDRGGLKILKQLSSTRRILYSAYVTPEISRLAEVREPEEKELKLFLNRMNVLTWQKYYENAAAMREWPWDTDIITKFYFSLMIPIIVVILNIGIVQFL